MDKIHCMVSFDIYPKNRLSGAEKAKQKCFESRLQKNISDAGGVEVYYILFPKLELSLKDLNNFVLSQ